MGIFGKLLSNIGGGADKAGGEGDDFDYSSIDQCPYCHDSLQGWECVSCDVEFVLEEDRLVEVLLSRRNPRAERRCTGCDTPMSRKAQFTSAWEEGDNSDSYITCPSCGYQNIF
ncbi:MAG: hypothetical protein WBG47_05790 [Gordonia sp. (in: high G+C Gram-positive bacteria)]|uniref:hypothetical protein n=1 Tax=Gordonia sp. (in: high G+C Gram-positive bacteria) TaxID=84139 RepID=UPI003C71A92E